MQSRPIHSHRRIWPVAVSKGSWRNKVGRLAIDANSGCWGDCNQIPTRLELLTIISSLSPVYMSRGSTLCLLSHPLVVCLWGYFGMKILNRTLLIRIPSIRKMRSSSRSLYGRRNLVCRSVIFSAFCAVSLAITSSQSRSPSVQSRTQAQTKTPSATRTASLSPSLTSSQV